MLSLQSPFGGNGYCVDIDDVCQTGLTRSAYQPISLCFICTSRRPILTSNVDITVYSWRCSFTCK